MLYNIFEKGNRWLVGAYEIPKCKEYINIVMLPKEISDMIASKLITQLG